MSKLIVANWKLNPASLLEARKLAGKIARPDKNKVVLCPPTLFLSSIDYPNLGAQDCFWKIKGPYTGQTSPLALKSMKIKYCIVGHSERRGIGETEEQVHDKVTALLENGITPILCIGFGTTASEDDMDVIDTLKEQLRSALRGVDSAKVVVAYEPVWALSSGNPYKTKHVENPEHAEKIAIYVKTKFGVKTVLYGGSANGVNAEEFLKQPNIGGLLVGGASLLPDDFNKIINL